MTITDAASATMNEKEDDPAPADKDPEVNHETGQEQPSRDSSDPPGSSNTNQAAAAELESSEKASSSSLPPRKRPRKEGEGGEGKENPEDEKEATTTSSNNEGNKELPSAPAADTNSNKSLDAEPAAAGETKPLKAAASKPAGSDGSKKKKLFHTKGGGSGGALSSLSVVSELLRQQEDGPSYGNTDLPVDFSTTSSSRFRNSNAATNNTSTGTRMKQEEDYYDLDQPRKPSIFQQQLAGASGALSDAEDDDDEPARRGGDGGRGTRGGMSTNDHSWRTQRGPPVLTPHIHDVLMGRGKRFSDHPGNITFREFIRQKKADYTLSWKFQKGEIAQQVLDKVKALDPPGRFLEKRADGYWVDIKPQKAFEKACQALRERKWDHPETIAQKQNEDQLTAPAADSEEEQHYTAADVPEMNNHISAEDLKKRVRAGARISVWSPSDGSFQSGRVLKRMYSKVLVEYDGDGRRENIDLSKRKINLDGRKLKRRDSGGGGEDERLTYGGVGIKMDDAESADDNPRVIKMEDAEIGESEMV